MMRILETTLAIVMAVALLAGSRPAAAFEVFQDPTNLGANTAGAASIPPGGCVGLNIWIDHGTNTPDPNTACSGTGGGDEQCGWDLHIVASGNATLQSFVAEGPPADIVDSGINLPGSELRANGGDPIFGEITPQRVGLLTACLTTPPGQVDVVGNLYVTAQLTTAAIAPGAAITLATGGGGCIVDADGDTICDTGAAGPCTGGNTVNCNDNCPFVANSLQEDTGGHFSTAPDGIGTACQCGDINGSGTTNTADGTLIKRAAAGLPPFTTVGALPIPGNCDVNGSGTCNTTDGTLIQRNAAGLPPFGVVTGQSCPNANPPPL